MSKNRLAFTAFAVLFVASAISVAYGVLSENDPTLLRVCWLPDGRAQYVGSDMEGRMVNASCDDPDPLTWDHDNLIVAIISATGETLDGTGDERLVINAMRLVNIQLDTNLTFTKNTAEADIIVTFRSALESEPEGHLIGGSCTHMRTGGKVRASLRLSPAGNIRTEYRRTIHEFGHCLGLGHWTGIMQTGDLDDSDRPRMGFDRFDDGQVSLMENTYP